MLHGFTLILLLLTIIPFLFYHPFTLSKPPVELLDLLSSLFDSQNQAVFYLSHAGR